MNVIIASIEASAAPELPLLFPQLFMQVVLPWALQSKALPGILSAAKGT